MKKSLIIIASALLLAVGAASHHRLRYDSSVFNASTGPAGGARTTRVEYPPCIKGVREDRCIQLYERGVRRNYQRWLAAHGRGATQTAGRGPTRAYPACRGRHDDRCQQRAARRQARLRQAQGQRRAAARQVSPRRATAARRAPQRVVIARNARQTRTATVQRPRTPAPTRPRTNPGGSSTPGI